MSMERMSCERAKELINTDIINIDQNKNINNINIEDAKMLVKSNKNNIEKESFKENIKEPTKPIYKPIAYSNQNKEVKKIPQAKTKNNPNKSNFLNFNFGNFSSFSDDFN
jgi:hypothetical protein